MRPHFPIALLAGRYGRSSRTPQCRSFTAPFSAACERLTKVLRCLSGATLPPFSDS